MEESWLGILFFIFIALGLISYKYQDFKHTKFRWSLNPVTKLSPNMKSQLPTLLNKYSVYYRNLNKQYQPEFERRVKNFITNKRFEVRNFPFVTDEMMVTLAAYAAQISLGYKDLILFEHFHTILIYPTPYKSTITKKVHKGEVNQRGYIVLSWKDVIEGGANPTDGRNLALHEMAHALQLENNIPNEDFEFFNPKHLDRLWGLAKLHHEDIKNNSLSFLREYASTNQKEFFAVCVENFFERPVELKKQHPYIFTQMVLLLKQDPIKLFSL